MYQRPLYRMIYLLVLVFTNAHPMEPAHPQPGLLDLPDDMLARIIIHTSLTGEAQFSPESLIPYARNECESSWLNHFATLGGTSGYRRVSGRAKARAHLALALNQIKPLLSTSRSARALMLNPTIARAVLNHFTAAHNTAPVYVATTLHQAQLITLIEQDQSGLASWRDINGLKRNFRGQLREAVTMILADTHDANRLKKAAWLINQKPHEFSPEVFTLILDNLICNYNVENNESAYFVLDKEPAFKTKILPKFIQHGKWRGYIADSIVNRFPNAKQQLSIEELIRLQHDVLEWREIDAENNKSAN